jgi:hypothetical protein
MGLKMVVFVDDDVVIHNFRHAFFDEKDGPLPCRDLGVYILLDRNDGGRYGPGTHHVLYVGQSETGGLRNRMFFHAEDPRYADRYRSRDTWPCEVLFVTDSDAEISRRVELSLLARRTAYEKKLHGLFVPVCSEQFGDAKQCGKNRGHVPTVTLDLAAGTLKWARCRLVEAAE